MSITAIAAITVGLHVGTWHGWDAGEHTNNVNPGIYVAADTRLLGKVSGGFYYNSVRRWSVYAVKSWTLGRGFEAHLGAVTGYNEASVLPLPALSWSPGWAVNPRITLIPKGFHFSVEKEF